MTIAQVPQVLPPPLKGEPGAGVPSGRNIEMLPSPGWLAKSASTIGSASSIFSSSLSQSSFNLVIRLRPLPNVLAIQALPLLSIAIPFPLWPPVGRTSTLEGSLAGKRVTVSPTAFVIQMRSCWSIARKNGELSLQGPSLEAVPAGASQKNLALLGSPLGM